MQGLVTEYIYPSAICHISWKLFFLAKIKTFFLPGNHQIQAPSKHLAGYCFLVKMSLVFNTKNHRRCKCLSMKFIVHVNRKTNTYLYPINSIHFKQKTIFSNISFTQNTTSRIQKHVFFKREEAEASSYYYI